MIDHQDYKESKCERIQGSEGQHQRRLVIGSAAHSFRPEERERLGARRDVEHVGPCAVPENVFPGERKGLPATRR